MNKLIKTLLMGLLLTSVMQSYTVQADDAELYVLNVSQVNNVKSKVLIVIDNSGSMELSYLTPQEQYDSAKNYIPLDILNDYRNRIYFNYTNTSSGSNIPHDFLWNYSDQAGWYSNYNNCNSVVSSGYGFTDLKYWQSGWLSLSTNSLNAANSKHLDCSLDISLLSTVNPATGDNGYPRKGSNSEYTTDINNAKTFNSAQYDAYTANYLYYRTRAYAAKKSVNDIVSSTYDSVTDVTSMDFGLEIFNDNQNNTHNGGRIISAIRPLKSSDQTKTNFINAVNRFESNTATPLAESIWEAFLYFSGSNVLWGNDNDNSITISADGSAQSNNKYISPLIDDCADYGYIILITDGDPTNDDAANTLIQSLTGQSSTYKNADGVDTNSYLPHLTGWMHDHDILDGVNGRSNKSGTQNISTYTISFGDSVSNNGKILLNAAAKAGGGAYYNATDASGLSSALNNIIKDIAARQFTMAAPSVAASNIDKTQYLDNLYMTGFVPGKGPFWGGNLKKLKYTSTGIKDANNNLALDSNGRLLSTAKTYWSSAADGNAIAKGGAQEMLAKLTTARTIYTHTTSSALTLLDAANFTSTQQKQDLGLSGSATVSDVATMISWIKGVDTDSALATKPNRATIIGDMMHSKPLVINYGASTQGGTPDLRIIAGTNSGFLHMFKDAGDTVSETWAYIPYPLLKNQATLKAASIAVDHISGIDGSPVSYVVDKNSDGQILSSTTGDKAWVFVGQRQGGRSYYALNVTNPDSPSLKWIITGGTTTGFSRLGQTWSTPQVTKIPGYKDDSGNYKPVLVFAGGYDTNKDAATIGTSDATGNAIYFVDADTGALIFSVSPDATSSTNLSVTTMLDSIPSDVTLFDSNGDGLTDRLYVGDTGGNLWRMDLPGTDKTKWSIFKLASLGSDVTLADDRRFFGAPLIVRSINPKVTKLADGTYKYTQQPYDAVMLGSGNRNKPSSDKTVNNAYFMIRDMHPAVYGETETKPTDASAIDISSLYDITGNKIGVIASTGPTAAQLTEIVALTSSKKGWFYKMTGSGEKVFGSGLVSNGILNFTSFIPEASAVGVNQCSLGASIGSTRLYSIDMTYGYYTGLTAYTSTNDLLLENLGSYVDSNGKVVGLGLPGGSLVSGNNDSGVAQCAEGQSCLQACTSATGCNGQTPTTGDLLPHMEYQYTHETN
jgi:type IV pilus assembly protein PilY1